MKTAVIYARYSSAGQSEQSIEGQLHVCYDYAKRNDLLIVGEYIDRAMTGTNDNRTSFQKLIKDSNKKAWNYVLVYKLDRFSRNKYEMAMHKKTLRDNGVKLLSAMENIPDTPEGIILESLLEGMAEYYSAELSQKVKRGMRESREKGNYTGGFVMFGYSVTGDKTTGRKIVINEDDAKIVRYIFNEYASGKFVEDIISELKEKGLTYKGKPFARSTVFRMLKCEKYIGIYKYKDQVFTNIYPRLIQDNIFEKVRKRTRENKTGKMSVKTVYYLRHKLFCGYCGSLMGAETGTAKNGEVKRYYKCYNKKAGGDCNKSQIRKDAIEQFVIERTINLLNNDKTVNRIADMMFDNIKQIETDKTVLKLLLKEQSKTQNQIDNFMKAIGQGIITNSTKTQLEKLEQYLEEINTKITLENAKEKFIIKKDDIIKYLKQCIELDTYNLIQLLIKKVILYDDKVEIHYNYINGKSPDEDSRDFLFTTKTFYLKSIVKGTNKNRHLRILVEYYF
ncbi:MAG: recombinase family protein [Clostridia bacterium]|nr:recombinase family protein [Clostridia bacterium]